MATKVVRTCDRLGCAIDMIPFAPGEDLPSCGTVGYTVLKTTTDEKGVTTTTELADFDEVCGSCSEQIEDLVRRIKGEKRSGKPRKDEAEKVEVQQEEKSEAKAEDNKKPAVQKPGGKKRGRPRKADVEARKAAEAAALAESEAVSIPETFDVDDSTVEDVISKAVDVALASSNETEEYVEAVDVSADVFETDTGEVVNADTGEVIASPADDEDYEDGEESSEYKALNGSEGAHPF